MPKEEGLREKGYLESQEGVVSLHFECSMVRLRHPAGVGRRVEQPGAGSHSWEVGEKGRPWLLGVALNANSFCAAWRKLSSGELGLFLGLKQAPGERCHQGRVGVWGDCRRELGGREVGLLQRQRGAGR